VHLGDTANIEVDAYNDRKFLGIVTEIASSNNGAASETSTTTSSTSTDVTNYKVYIRLQKSSYRDLLDPAHPNRFPFRPGMSATADIQTRTKMNVLSIPINAVTTRPKNDSSGITSNKVTTSDDNTQPGQTTVTENDLDEVVFQVMPDGTVQKKVVTTGIQDINYIELTSGVKEGDELVTGPYDVVSKTLQPKNKVQVVPKSELFNIKK